MRPDFVAHDRSDPNDRNSGIAVVRPSPVNGCHEGL